MSDKHRINPGTSLSPQVTDAGVIVPAGSLPLVVAAASGGDVYVRFGDAAMVVGDILVPPVTPHDRCLVNGCFDVELERRESTHLGLRTMAGVVAVVQLSPAQAVRP
jgi:hypothetical protein